MFKSPLFRPYIFLWGGTSARGARSAAMEFKRVAFVECISWNQNYPFIVGALVKPVMVGWSQPRSSIVAPKVLKSFWGSRQWAAHNTHNWVLATRNGRAPWAHERPCSRRNIPGVWVKNLGSIQIWWTEKQKLILWTVNLPPQPSTIRNQSFSFIHHSLIGH